jgi:type III restriction enzyme
MGDLCSSDGSRRRGLVRVRVRRLSTLPGVIQILGIPKNGPEGRPEQREIGCKRQKKYPSEFGGEKLLIIHTDKSGEVSKKDLDKARKASREVDHESSPVSCIVSVLMLREGWDVQSVTVIVGLRPYTSRANILPEQTVGRGLRLMFRGFGSGYIERVDVIGNRAFIEFVEQLEREEDLRLETFDVGKDKVKIVTIQPDEQKKDKDISIPVLGPILMRKKSLAKEIADLDVASFNCPVLPRKEGDVTAKNFRYEGFDIITLQKMVEREYKIPEPQTPEEVIGYYARRVAQDVKLPSQFAALAPKVREFLERKAFGESVNLNDADILKAISSNVAQYVTENVRRSATQDGGRGIAATTTPRWPRIVGDTAIPLVAAHAGGGQVHFQSRAVRQRV